MKIANIKIMVENIKATQGSTLELVQRQMRGLRKLLGYKVVKVSLLSERGTNFRILEFNCRDDDLYTVELRQYADGTWDIPIEDDGCSLDLPDLKDYHRNLGAAIKFIEADESHWIKKCEKWETEITRDLIPRKR